MTMTFFDYWKPAVRLAGEEYFTLRVDDIDAATDKNQLRPDVAAIRQRLKTASKGEAIFLACLFAFFNPWVAQELLAELGHPNLCEIADKLDQERLAILWGLSQTYEGW